ncbi:MAG: hypothetical protein Q4G59_12545, partial [Planctomycetia bacterium]|nr:hypothetical protein [Planctomycetia bacterium]
LKNFLKNGGNKGAGAKGVFAVPASKDPLRNSKKHAQEETTQAAPAQTGTLTGVPASLNEKWDRFFVENSPKQPVLAKGDSDEINATNNTLLEQYKKDSFRFNNELMAQVLDFCKAKQFDEAKALIYACIRSNSASPWVYEALVLVLLQSGAPQAEVEKAILSVADFASDPVTIMGVAAYLESVDSKKRALDLFHEVSKVVPTRPEPYVRGLALSQELNDEEAQKWVCIGIASQAWEGKLVDSVWQAGADLAQRLIAKMMERGQTEEAAKFEKALAQAKVRDVIVEVWWTGDAEIDLAVQEPTNAVCWFAAPRTSSGGILKTDSVVLSKSSESLKDGRRVRVYTCPMGYNGEYSILVSRSWGTLPQNKVGIHIITNAGTDHEHNASYTLELKNDQACFAINLENGRRQEDVKQEVLTAAALVNQMQVHNQRQLAEKVRQYQDSRVASSARQASETQVAASGYKSAYQTKDGVKSVAGVQGVKGRNAEYSMPEVQYTQNAGYMPIIQSFPVGLGWQITPNSVVVTDARRYVLLSGPPQFTGLLRMFTYNTADGSSSSMGGM